MLRQKFASAAFLVLTTASLSADSAPLNDIDGDKSVFCTDVLSHAIEFNQGRQASDMLMPALDRAIDDGQRKYGSTPAFMGYLLGQMVESTSEESEARKDINSYYRYNRKFDLDVRQCLLAYSK